jgi:formylglycine-generating enzyme required for sulfatase activity
MIIIPAGPFLMGSDSGTPWERPARAVYVDQFSIARTTVTREEYSAFLDATGHPLPKAWDDPAFGEPRQPVVGVNWFDANAYCAWLSVQDHIDYRLPSEAEWEKACRGGLTGTMFSWGNMPPEQIDYYRTKWSGPRKVGEQPANPFGLLNMGDNVHEWCMDWYGADYYTVMPAENPRGPKSGTRRVSRGGSWRHRVKASANAHRSSLPPEYRYTDYGFRVAADVPH